MYSFHLAAIFIGSDMMLPSLSIILSDVFLFSLLDSSLTLLYSWSLLSSCPVVPIHHIAPSTISLSLYPSLCLVCCSAPCKCVLPLLYSPSSIFFSPPFPPTSQL